jgi:predicted nucleotidyltransferase
MPADGSVLGFKNRWYRDGMEHAEEFKLPDGQIIHVISLAHLLASKLEAFGDRGHDDYLGSSDIEDILALIDGCSDIESKISRAPDAVRNSLAEQFSRLLKNAKFLLAVDGNLSPSGRTDRGLDIIRRIAGSA